MAHAHEEINRPSALVRAEANGPFQMLDREVVLAGPQPELGAHVPAASKAGVQLQGSVGKIQRRRDILSEVTESIGSACKNVWIVSGVAQCPSGKIDAFVPGRLQIVRPTTCVHID